MEKQKLEQIHAQNKQIYVHLYPFRAVFPYHYKYETFAKSRWYGKPLLQTLVKQFKAYNFEYYKSAIEQGRIKMNGKNVPIDYLIRNGDKLIHSAIREQPPILDLDIQIVEDNQDYLVVNKPPSFTVHTGGGFHYNTLSSILEIQHGYKDLFVLHRLDRLTSGLIIYGKSKQKPQIFHKQNQNQSMKKMYYARVSGDFTWNQKTLYAQIQCVSHKDGVYKVTKEIQQNKQTQKVKSQENQNLQKTEEKIQQKKLSNELKKKNKKNEALNNPDLKDSKTHFKKVSYDKQSDSTLIECYPISGRTHQIRVHLQFLGFPILNDTVYGGRFIGNNIIKNIKQKQEKQFQKNQVKDGNEKDLIQNHGSKKVKCQNQISKECSLSTNNQKFKEQNKRDSLLQSNSLKNEEIIKLKQKISSEWDVKTRPWQICLHSFQYILEGQVYRTRKPYWAEDNFHLQT